MGWPDGHPRSGMGYLYFIKTGRRQFAPTLTIQLCTYLLLASLLSFPPCVYRPFNYRMTVPLPRCGFSWISLMCSFFVIQMLSPRSPHPLQFHPYISWCLSPSLISLFLFAALCIFTCCLACSQYRGSLADVVMST
jgi:hypothetical protein